MTDKPKPSTKKKSFPIRNFARLLDEFINSSGTLDDDMTIKVLREDVDRVLIAHYKR
jgi:hypothetical protein